MIRTLKRHDMEHILNIWLEGNKEAHDFIAGEYWETYLPTLRKQLLQAEIYVYQKNRRAAAFYQQEGFTVLSGEVDEDTGEMDLTMTWNKKNDFLC